MKEIDNIEAAILAGTLYNTEFLDKTLPFIKDEYFQSSEYKVIFSTIKEYINNYNKPPPASALIIELENQQNLSDEQFKSCNEIINTFSSNKDKEIDLDWLVDRTERWCQDSAFYNVLIEAAAVIDDKKSNVSKFGMPDAMADALSISFDSSIGHDYFADAEERFKSWHEKDKRLEFNIDMLNRITKGGLPPKSFSLLMSSKTGGFKSGFMCSLSADYLMKGKNVLYITLELSEAVVAERIDANLLQVDLDDLRLMSEKNYLSAVKRNEAKTKGKLVIKEYATGTGHAGHFRFLIKELQSKHNFKPDVIFIDYVNICASSLLNSAAASNTNLYVGSIGKELRGLAVEFGLPVMSATQSGRQAISGDELGLDDISDSIALANVSDLIIGLITSPELDEMQQIICKQLKNRFGDVNKWNTFPVGVNKPQMRLFNLDDNSMAKPIPTGGYKMEELKEDQDENILGYSRGSRSKKSKFDNFKV